MTIHQQMTKKCLDQIRCLVVEKVASGLYLETGGESTVVCLYHESVFFKIYEPQLQNYFLQFPVLLYFGLSVLFSRHYIFKYLH